MLFAHSETKPASSKIWFSRRVIESSSEIIRTRGLSGIFSIKLVAGLILLLAPCVCVLGPMADHLSFVSDINLLCVPLASASSVEFVSQRHDTSLSAPHHVINATFMRDASHRIAQPGNSTSHDLAVPEILQSGGMCSVAWRRAGLELESTRTPRLR